jgi:serine/threonine protein kinase
VKVLDFGLAKPFAEAGAGASADSGADTLTATMTEAGAVMGTPSYMSPEQTRGRDIDKRTDIWAIGCVLYELLTRRRAFRGETSGDTIAAVLDREPDWNVLPPSIPPRVRELVRRCLQKDVRRRTRDAGDIAIEIEEILAQPVGVAASGRAAAHTRSRGARAVPFLVAALVIAAALAGGYARIFANC